jgi:hypothetical protein
MLAVDAYSGMELCMPTWLNHDYGDGGVVDILAVEAYSRVEVCTSIFLGEASNYFWVANHVKWTYPLTKLNSTQTRVAMSIIFDSGRNVYVVEEPS